VLLTATLLSCEPAGVPSAPHARVAAPAPKPTTRPVALEAPAPTSAPKPPAPPGAGELVALSVDGFAEAVVAVPRVAPTPRPIVVATHGNYDRPEWQCEVWQAIVAERAFVLCPRGKTRRDSPSANDVRFTYSSNMVLQQELDAALPALLQRWAGHVDDGPVVYTGFSLGAIMGVKIAARQPKRYPRLVLVEGGYNRWTPERVRAYARGGGQRVLFVCGQRGCESAAKQAAMRLERAGVRARVVAAIGEGHSYGGAVSKLAAQEMPWVLEDDPRWPVDQQR